MKRKMLLLFIALVLLSLPVFAAPAAYQVREGDTLWSIARRFNTSVERILELNPGIRPNHLVIGQRIAVKEANQNYIYHTVKKGETLWTIAEMYNLRLEDVLDANRLTYFSTPIAGQRLRIPTYGPKGEYRVKPGDTYWSIAKAQGTTVARLMTLNPGVDPDSLRVGQTLVVERSTERAFHFVRSGETLYQIAVRHGVTVADLMAWNGISRPESLYVGQHLFLEP
jgi:LysM repeat protein